MSARPSVPPVSGCDTSDILVIHAMFRRLLTQAPALVRAVPPGDVARAKVVADHVDEVASGLHNHHHGEDILLWDQLTERVPACAVHVDQMRAQHAAVAELLERLAETVPPWRETADADAGSRVAAAIDEVRTSLFAHLGDEEEQIVPVAGTAMTQAEWDRLGEHAIAAIPPKRRLVQLGYVLAEMPESDRDAWLKGHVPPPVRILYKVSGKRQYLAEQRRLFQTAG